MAPSPSTRLSSIFRRTRCTGTSKSDYQKPLLQFSIHYTIKLEMYGTMQ